MNANSLKLIRQERTLKNLAKYMALHCFRNTCLEDLHCGTTPSSKTGDFSDVKVITPYGEIPWNKLSRLSDKEMKKLMINVIDQCWLRLWILFEGSDADQLIEFLSRNDIRPEWNDPPSSDFIKFMRMLSKKYKEPVG